LPPAFAPGFLLDLEDGDDVLLINVGLLPKACTVLYRSVPLLFSDNAATEEAVAAGEGRTSDNYVEE
jgi:hypothetical protein